MQERIDKALKIADRFALIDGDHHKMWVIDQMVRALTGCPDVPAEDAAGRRYGRQGESPEYLAFTVDGGGWDEGIAP